MQDPVEDPTIVEEMNGPEVENTSRVITQNNADLFPLLRVESKECTLPLEEADKAAILDMYKELEEQGDNAVGVAAVQIGHPRRMFVLRTGNGMETFINPEIVVQSSDVTKKEEGCLSLPGFFIRVPRPRSLTLRYNDPDGNLREQSFEGLMSRAVCHEMDHLNGVLLSDRFEKQMTKYVQKKTLQVEARNRRTQDSRRKEKNRRKAQKKNRRR